MYSFNKMQNSDGTWRLELDGISLIVDGFTVEKEKHQMKNPEKAIAFFNVHGNVYGVSNQYKIYSTVEDFFDVMLKQYSFFNSGTGHKGNAYNGFNGSSVNGRPS